MHRGIRGRTINNYDKEMFNGDIGRVKAIAIVKSELMIEFDDRQVFYPVNELEAVSLAYATTLHKCRGSE